MILVDSQDIRSGQKISDSCTILQTEHLSITLNCYNSPFVPNDSSAWLFSPLTSFSRPNALASASPMQDISTPVIVPSIPKKLKDLGPCTADEVQKNHVTRWGNQLVESGTFEPRFRTCLNNVEHDQEEMIDNRVEAITKTCKMTLEACARFSTAEANKKRLILNCYQMKTKTYDKLLSSNKYSRHLAVAECHSPFVDASTLIESTMIRIFSRTLIHATQL